MNLEYIKIFVAVYRAKSFTSVANTLSVSPSSVSRAIATLEGSLETRLFQRTTRLLTPTLAGERYFERVEVLIEELDNARQEIVDDSKGPSGCLRITASVSYGQTVIAPLLTKFYQRYPNIQIELILSDNTIDLVENQIDLAIRHGHLQTSSLIARKLKNVSYSVVASPAYLDRFDLVTQPESLTAYSLITFMHDGFRNEWKLRRGELTKVIPINPIMSTTNANVIKECVTSGLGLAILADWTTKHEIDSGQLMKVLPEWEAAGHDFDSAIWLVHPSRSFVPTKTRALIDFLLEAVV